MIGALACTFAACSDDDGNKRNIEDCRPAIYTQAKASTMHSSQPRAPKPMLRKFASLKPLR